MDDFEWEQQEEEVPKRLREQWDQEEVGQRRCPHCGQLVASDVLLCLFCGESTKLKAGVFAKLRAWVFESPPGVVILGLFFVGLLLFLL